MKALCLKQPHASLVVGLKLQDYLRLVEAGHLDEVEGIVNSAPEIVRKTIETRTWQTKHLGELLIVASKNPVIKGLPSGVAVAVVEVIGCRPMTEQDEAAACCELYPEAQAWLLANIRAVQPFPVKGQLRIFNVDVPDLSSIVCSNCSKFPPKLSIMRDPCTCQYCPVCGRVWDPCLTCDFKHGSYILKGVPAS